MASFGPAVILAVLVATRSISERKSFEDSWKKAVRNTAVAWIYSYLKTQSKFLPQLQWEANIVEYVMFLYKETKPPKNSKATKTYPARALGPNIPIYGPRFIPPSLNDHRLRMSKKINPEIAYLRPINIIHPVFYSDIGKCPSCGSEDITWDSWTTSGSREVHGLR
ncbi:hypothetical protein B0H10DRAFT_1795155 [Mycena sp. CBHHK59/15]|nr:hypothetical protein B0H10DRAFT_1795155 [Mycena sp. CBHHK59/15]